MDQVIDKLIRECVRSEKERKRFWILLSVIQPGITKYFDKEIVKEARIIANEEIKTLGGINEVETRYNKANKDYVDRFSALAGFLDEEEGFDDVEKFNAQLNEEQLSWLRSHIREIKNYL